MYMIILQYISHYVITIHSTKQYLSIILLYVIAQYKFVVNIYTAHYLYYQQQIFCIYIKYT